MSENEQANTNTGDGHNGKIRIFSASTDATKKVNEINRDRVRQWADIKFFTIPEFDSPDLGDSGLKMNIEFLKVLDAIRHDCGFALKITSGYRTPARNALVGGKAGSAHLDGLAADISIIDSQQRFKLIQVALKHGVARIGIAKTFIHLDLDFKLPQAVCWLY